MSGRVSPLGRPKCASSSTIAPRSLSSRTVGSIARSRVSSVTLALSIGTLRSTRTSTFLPVSSSGRSSRVLNALTLPELAHRMGGVDHAVREAPLVVVPADDADQLAVEHGGLEAVDCRAGRRMDDVGRDKRVLAVDEHAAQAVALTRRLQDLVHFLTAGVAARCEGQVDKTSVRNR